MPAAVRPGKPRHSAGARKGPPKAQFSERIVEFSRLARDVIGPLVGRRPELRGKEVDVLMEAVEIWRERIANNSATPLTPQVVKEVVQQALRQLNLTPQGGGQ